MDDVAGPDVHSRRWPVSSGMLLLLAGGLLLTACTGQEAQLAGRSFVSVGVTGRELVEGSSLRLTFETDRVVAVAGCNTLTGSASWSQERLSVPEPLASTMMGCEPELAAQDQWVSEFLTSAPSLDLADDTLTLRAGDVEVTLVDDG